MIKRTRDTELSYTKKVISLMIKAYREANSGGFNITRKSIMIANSKGNVVEALPIFITCIWAGEKWAQTLSKSSWRLYRAALTYHLEVSLRAKKITQSEHDKAVRVMREASGEDVGALRTSAMKLKNISNSQLETFIIKLKNRSGKWGVPSALWFLAGTSTGLRPSEWKDIQLAKVGGVVTLRVRNAKATNGRGHGDFRDLSLEHLKKEEIKLIVEHIKNIRKHDYQKMYNGCSKAIQSVSRQIWPNKSKYPTLYTARHQFSANSKASGCSRIELAALMGHASDATASTHYGKKRYGTKGVKPEASAENISKVREKYKGIPGEDLTSKVDKNK